MRKCAVNSGESELKPTERHHVQRRRGPLLPEILLRIPQIHPLLLRHYFLGELRLLEKKKERFAVCLFFLIIRARKGKQARALFQLQGTSKARRYHGGKDESKTHTHTPLPASFFKKY